jgi:hypothetical protein
MADFYRSLLGVEPVAKSENMPIFMSGETAKCLPNDDFAAEITSDTAKRVALRKPHFQMSDLIVNLQKHFKVSGIPYKYRLHALA